MGRMSFLAALWVEKKNIFQVKTEHLQDKQPVFLRSHQCVDAHRGDIFQSYKFAQCFFAQRSCIKHVHTVTLVERLQSLSIVSLFISLYYSDAVFLYHATAGRANGTADGEEV